MHLVRLYLLADTWDTACGQLFANWNKIVRRKLSTDNWKIMSKVYFPSKFKRTGKDWVTTETANCTQATPLNAATATFGHAATDFGGTRPHKPLPPSPPLSSFFFSSYSCRLTLHVFLSFFSSSPSLFPYPLAAFSSFFYSHPPLPIHNLISSSFLPLLLYLPSPSCNLFTFHLLLHLPSILLPLSLYLPSTSFSSSYLFNPSSLHLPPTLLPSLLITPWLTSFFFSPPHSVLLRPSSSSPRPTPHATTPRNFSPLLTFVFLHLLITVFYSSLVLKYSALCNFRPWLVLSIHAILWKSRNCKCLFSGVKIVQMDILSNIYTYIAIHYW